MTENDDPRTKVFFTKEITPESLIKIFKSLECELKSKVAVLMNTGEPGSNNYLKPELVKDLISSLKGTIIEGNSAYGGKRQNLNDHLKSIKNHGFKKIARVEVLETDGEISIPTKKECVHLKENFIGKNIEKYNSLLVLSHFTGHALSGFSGCLSNLSLNICTTKGKLNIHSAGGSNLDQNYVFNNLPPNDYFLESMAEAADSIVDYFKKKNGIVFINVLNNISVDSDDDCNAAGPCMNDIGICASLDPVALERASLDMIFKADDKGREKLIERIQEKHGDHIIEHAICLGMGSSFYRIVDVDK